MTRTQYSIRVKHITPEGLTYVGTLFGREAWALFQLIKHGEQGCTPIDNPAPRWSAYVHLLRGYGFSIETITERHGGPFPGTHARYVLRSLVTIEDVKKPFWS